MWAVVSGSVVRSHGVLTGETPRSIRREVVSATLCGSKHSRRWSATDKQHVWVQRVVVDALPRRRGALTPWWCGSTPVLRTQRTRLSCSAARGVASVSWIRFRLPSTGDRGDFLHDSTPSGAREAAALLEHSLFAAHRSRPGKGSSTTITASAPPAGTSSVVSRCASERRRCTCSPARGDSEQLEPRSVSESRCRSR